MLKSNITRRTAVVGLLSSTSLALVHGPAWAVSSTGQAESLITKVVGEISRIANGGGSESSKISKFERVFRRYADLPTISRTVLGADARSASSGQLSSFSKAFSGYMARKYGKRFRSFIGGQVEITSSRPVKSFFEVKTVAKLKGRSNFDVTFLVSGRSSKFFDMLIEGVSLLKSERTEIGAMLDRRKGDINALIADLRKAG
ncbi:MAG: ABC transporter substrate-binding protein [Rhodobacteraceae bacterium]|nr:ABC transporter substrate-binding protein [Paracoccaceae bacterium]